MIVRLFPAAALAALLMTLTACSPAETEAEAPPRVARIETVQPASAPTTREFVGRVEARQTVDLAPQVGGRLTELPVAEGQRVSRGDLIARLETQDYQRAVREAEVQRQQAETALNRQRTLHERGIASDAALEDAQTQYDLASVALENARQNLDYTAIEAPFDGLVGRRLVDNFTTVAQGQAVVRLQDLSERRVAIPVPETLLGLLDSPENYQVSASFPFLPGRDFPLEYRELVAEAQPGSQTYVVLFALPEILPGNVLPGMTANVRVSGGRNGADRDEGGVRAPVGALAGDERNGFRVWVFNPEDQSVSPREVELGPINGDTVLVADGLAAGERIVTAGVNALHEGMKVRPMAAGGIAAASQTQNF